MPSTADQQRACTSIAFATDEHGTRADLRDRPSSKPVRAA